MKKTILVILKYLFLCAFGGLVYNCVELLWRGWTHWSMTLCGGLCFIVYGLQNEYVNWEMPLCSQLVIGATLTTGIEFIFGYIVNILLNLHVWDYSNTPYNFMGQICLVMWFAWVALGIVAIPVDDYIRYFIFHEEKPRYNLFGYRRCVK